MKTEKAQQDHVPAGVSIVNKLTGDSAHLLHQEKERQRERLREKVVQSFHTQKENTNKFQSHRGSRQTLMQENSFTGLPVGRDDSFQRQVMKAELGRTLREQMSVKQERERTNSNKRRLNGSYEQKEWAEFNYRKD